MRIFFSSDTHYFHANIIKYCDRPFKTVDEMNEFMIDAWNSFVDEDDLTFHLGDFSLLRPVDSDQLRDVITRLKGKKILVKGNHDKDSDSFFLDAGFKKVYDSINVAGVLLVHYPLHEAFSRKVKDSHWGEVSHVIHGHSHDKKNPNLENHYNVAVDRHEFCPVSLQQAVPENLQKNFFLEAVKLF
jgi:calcineurin-like phosphoesterase family protein